MYSRRRSQELDDLNTISDVELSECDREKLHLLGSIQDGVGHVVFFSHPEGEILGVDLKIGNVPWIRIPGTRSSRLAAEPISEFHELEPPRKERRIEKIEESESPAEVEGETDAQNLLGSNIESCIPVELMTHTSEAIASMRKARSQRTFRFFSREGQSYAITFSTTKDDASIICMEIEETESFEGNGNVYNTLVALGRVMEFYADEQVLQNACDTVFKLLENYDRGMVYQFNDDLSGEVVHEIKKSHLTSSYQGMRFPASDIPLPARQLYVQNGLRYIYNVNSDYNSILDNEKCEIDLSNCRMRAVAKPHIVYLRNMGVVCSLSVAIVVDGELWGLLAFHGYTRPFMPSLHQRIACESIMSMVSVKVESIMRKETSGRIIQLSDTIMRWDHSHSVAYNLKNTGDDLLRILDADVIVGLMDDPLTDEPEQVILGDASLAPTDNSYWKRLETQPSRKVISIHTREEVEALELSQQVCPASGFVYFHDALVKMMLGRGLRAKDVCWAGKPDEPKLRIGQILCPRNSFETFMEKAKKESRAWVAADLHVITTFMERVCAISQNRTVTLLKNDIETANVKYLDALSKAEDNSHFFAQMSHELRTPFHGVMGCLNIMHDSYEEMSNEDIQDMINTALSTGNHMICLLNDILNISKDRHLAKILTLESVELQELAVEPIGKLKAEALMKKITLDFKVNADQSKQSVITDKKKVKQIISNIVSNGIKFSEGGTINVHMEVLDSMIDAVDRAGTGAAAYAGTVFAINEDALYGSVEKAKLQVLQMDRRVDHKWILVSVADSGCGMKPGELAEMLKPYTQSSKGSNRAFQGTGLGLFICVSLCHQLHGFIACSSTPNVGSVFHVGIPVKMDDKTTATEQGELAEGIPKVVYKTP